MAARARIASGTLRHQVEVRRKTRTRGAAGGFVESAAVLKTVPASVRPLSGRELMDARQVEPRTTHEVVMRYDPDVAPLTSLDELGHRGRSGELRTFNILSVRDVEERGVAWLVMCEEAGTP